VESSEMAHSTSEKSEAGHALSDENNMETSLYSFSHLFFPAISHSDVDSVNESLSDVEGIEIESALPILSLQKSDIVSQHHDTESNANSEKIDHLPGELDPYLSILNVCLSEAGENAFGIAAIELWVMEDNELIRCRGGYWRDPVFPKNNALDRLENPHHAEYVPPVPLAPGVGTVGTLWVNVCGDSKQAKWIDLYELSQEEDQSDDVRLGLLSDVFGLATGLYFHDNCTDTRGVVIFYARRTVDFKIISSRTNIAYMKSSADMVASIVSWKIPREEAIMSRQLELKATLRRIRAKLVALSRFGALNCVLRARQSEIVVLPSRKKRSSICGQIVDGITRTAIFMNMKIRTTTSKMKNGGGQNPPPSFSPNQIIFALLGCFLSLISLSFINELLSYNASSDLTIILAPLGALVTCHYGLTSSPASQPRNSFVGILITSIMSTSSTYIPVWILPVWVRIPLVTSLGIGTTLALGFAHPPAGAVAIVFAQRNEASWKAMVMLLIGYIEAIFFATVFINLHDSTTFPMYWGFPNFKKWFSRK